jgi:CMP-N-acetylneuraminic acid synthetase
MSQANFTSRNPRRLAIIPARGGSKRIPGKNLIDICGFPIIDYPIKTAIASKLFQEILVSSDDEVILNHVMKLGNVSTSKRPKELSGDFTTVYATLRHEYLLKKQNRNSFDEIWLISATACLIDEIDLSGLAKAFKNSKTAASMLAVTEYEVPVQWAMSIDKHGRLKSLDFASFKIRSQDLEKFYHDAGCLAVFSPSVFDTYEEGVPEGEFEPYILSRGKTVDLDYPEDLDLVRALVSQKQKLL